MPVSSLPGNPPIQSTIQNIPQFADGGGWTTKIILTNPTDSQATGELRAFDQAGNGMTITLNATTGTTFAYSIPPRSFQTFQSTVYGPGVPADLHVSARPRRDTRWAANDHVPRQEDYGVYLFFAEGR
jgi:hypothetical protein